MLSKVSIERTFGGCYAPVVAPATRIQGHGLTVKVTCFCGFFLLISAAGCIGSAVLISRQQTPKPDWPSTSGHVKACNVFTFKPAFKIDGTSYTLLCDISYQFRGRKYDNVLDSGSTRSLQVRSVLAGWMAQNGRESDLAIRINPKHPYTYVVQTPLPFHHGRDPDGFAYAAVVMAGAGIVLVTIGRRLIRAGW